MLSDIKRFELQKVKIDRSGHQPLYAQINDELCRLLDQNFVSGDAFYSEQEITRALGVSRITVRRVIDDMDRAGRLVRQPGRKAIVAGPDGSESGPLYRNSGRPRHQSSFTQSFNIRTIVLVGLTWKSEYVLEVVDKLTAVCSKLDLELKVRMIGVDEFETFPLSVTAKPHEEAFLLFIGSRYGKKLNQALTARGYRTVSIDTMSSDYEGSVVSTDVTKVIQLGVAHLIELGHERIVLLVNEPIIHESVIEKVVEFKRLTIERGLSGRVVVAGGPTGFDSHDAAYAHMPEVWADGELRPTAIITVSDPGAWAAQKWLRERGVGIPERVSVVGFENARSSSHVAPPLTTIAHPVERIISRAVELLTNGLAEAASLNETIEPVLILRSSTGPVAA